MGVRRHRLSFGGVWAGVPGVIRRYGRRARDAGVEASQSSPPAEGGRPAIELVDITKVYDPALRGRDGVTVVRDLSLSIREGEFFSLLGPSGCGKSTTLRMLAGFETPTHGRILLRGTDVTGLRPAKRDLNMVFQAYALFPHMTVAENVGFGLRVKRVGGADIADRVREALRAVRLDALGDRRPSQLSGGQQQRVALARALVNRPAALLLDEPLGALDLKLREEMQVELKAIQARTTTTFIYVTHDQDEALTMSDRIAVMTGGVIDQVASPRRLYERPATPFVAGFIGTSNLVDFRVDEVRGDTGVMQLGEYGHIQAPLPGHVRRDQVLKITVRPEKIALTAPDDDAPCSRVRARLLDIVYRGSVIELVAELPGGERLTVRRLNLEDGDPHERGDDITLHWRRQHSFIVGSEPGEGPAPVADAPWPSAAR